MITFLSFEIYWHFSLPKKPKSRYERILILVTNILHFPNSFNFRAALSRSWIATSLYWALASPESLMSVSTWKLYIAFNNKKKKIVTLMWLSDINIRNTNNFLTSSWFHERFNLIHLWCLHVSSAPEWLHPFVHCIISLRRFLDLAGCIYQMKRQERICSI